jgi:Ca-activated chloride channel family protein
VVLTDGSNTTGVEPSTAAEQAAARRVRVYTIGFGTTEPAQMMCTADQVSSDSFFRPDAPGGGFGGFGGFGGRNREIDEEALTEVADITGGRYFRAEDAGQLSDVFDGLPRQIGVQKQDVEITVWFVLAGVLLAFTGAGLALWWTRAAAVRRPTARAG